MVGGWLAGMLDEHQGAPQHDNSIMVGAMALMAGMMGGMPSGMIGGMMSIMGFSAIGMTMGTGVALIALVWIVMLRGRYVVKFESRHLNMEAEGTTASEREK